MKNKTLLGELTPARFLREYWHKKPLLIRQAIPDFKPLLSREALFELAARDDVESRLITYFKQQWQLKTGPFPQLPSPRKSHWTVLIQGANLHDDAADALLQQFRFLPDARLDDLMISYATPQGGVGPHFDSYDVFLLQAYGKRRWRISAQKDLSLMEGMPLKILQNFQPQQEFVLEPGDMLYLPPHYAHDGTAEDECMTYSIGFRAPSYQELGEAFLQFMMETIDLPGRYADPDLVPSRSPAALSSAMIERVMKQMEKMRFTKEDVTHFLGEYFSEPKPSVFFSSPKRVPSPAQFEKQIQRYGVKLNKKTRMLHRNKNIFINGESYFANTEDKAVLSRLADERKLGPDVLTNLSKDVMEAFYIWYEDGWLELDK
jgi:50S ribosomal protein L16 3-hydroxylase